MDSPPFNYRFLRDPDEESVDLLLGGSTTGGGGDATPPPEEDARITDPAKADGAALPFFLHRDSDHGDGGGGLVPSLSQSSSLHQHSSLSYLDGVKTPSPATQTLNELSQHRSDDLRYDLSQLQRDIALADRQQQQQQQQIPTPPINIEVAPTLRQGLCQGGASSDRAESRYHTSDEADGTAAATAASAPAVSRKRDRDGGSSGNDSSPTLPASHHPIVDSVDHHRRGVVAQPSARQTSASTNGSHADARPIRQCGAAASQSERHSTGNDVSTPPTHPSHSEDGTNVVRSPGIVGGGTVRQSRASGCPVEQLDSLGELVLERFVTLTEAASTTGIGRHFIRRAMQQRGQTAGGYQWRAPPSAKPPLTDRAAGEVVSAAESRFRFLRPATKVATGGGPDSSDDIVSRVIEPSAPSKPCCPVEQLDAHGKAVLQRFASLSDAESATGIQRQYIRRAMHHRGQKAGGFQWRAAAESGRRAVRPAIDGRPDSSGDNVCRVTEPRAPSKRCCPVEQLDAHGKVLKRFASLRDAESATGIQRLYIRRAMQHPGQRAGDFQWRAPPIDRAAAESVRSAARPASRPLTRGGPGISGDNVCRVTEPRAPSKRCCPVEQLDAHGKVLKRFASLRDAESATGIQRLYIRRAMQHPGQRAGDFQWRAPPTEGAAKSVSSDRSSLPTRSPPLPGLDPATMTTMSAASQCDPLSPSGQALSHSQKEEGNVKASGCTSQTLVERRPNAHAVHQLDTATTTEPPKVSPNRNVRSPLGSKTSHRSQSPILPTPLNVSVSGSFSMQSVVIYGEGPLGFVVSRAVAPPSLLSALGIQPSDSEKAYCGYVRSLNEGQSLARNCGLLPNDIFLTRSAPECSVALMPYLDVIDRAKNGTRPITFLVARPRADSITKTALPTSGAKAAETEPSMLTGRQPQSTQPNPKVLPTSNASHAASHKPSVREATSRPSTSCDAFKTLAVVPFCTKCNTGRARMHHAWCPRHPHFLGSGAHDLLSRIRLGAEALGCPTCLQEYQQGRRTKAPHSISCRSHGSAPSTQPLQSANKRKTGDSAGVGYRPTKQRRGHDSNVSTSDKVVGHKDVDTVSESRHQPAYDSDPTDGPHYDSDSSGYHPPPRRRVELAADLSHSVEPSKKQATTNTTSLLTRRKIGVSHRAKALPRPEQQGSVRAITPNEAVSKEQDAGQDESDSEIADIRWVPAEDPWGPDGYQEGDVVLSSGRAKGIGHIETVLPSLRFEIDPFVSSKLYSTTHRTPEEGFQVLELRRDPLARLEWGFSVMRHEFGGACLVNAVTPMSPASSAVYIAASTKIHSGSGLRVNDMLICLNGKRVGGLMESEVELELEVCGPRLTLVVSRCKRTNTLEGKLWEAERQYQKAVDEALNDPHRLGWVDLVARPSGAASSVQARPVSAITAAVGAEGATSTCQDKGPPVVSARFAASTVQPTPTCARLAPFSQDDTLSSNTRVPDTMCYMDSVLQLEPSATSTSPRLATRVYAERGPDFDNSATARSSPSIKKEEPAREHADFIALTQEDLASEYENAWMGCVCGVVHDKTVPVFWIQCDYCQSWYNVSPQCVSFDENDAQDLPSWTCWGCPSFDSSQSEKHHQTTEHPKESTIDDTVKAGQTIDANSAEKVVDMSTTLNTDGGSESPVRPLLLGHDDRCGEGSAPQYPKHQRNMESNETIHAMTQFVASPNWNLSHQRQTADEEQQLLPHKASSVEDPFSKGEIVFVKDYGPRDHGVASVLQYHVDEWGNRSYDVKFIVGCKCKGIPAEHVVLHQF